MYTGEVWPHGLTGEVMYDDGDGAVYRIKLDQPYSDYRELSWLTRNMTPARPSQTVRARVLDEAKRITATDRNSSYGEPEDNFQRIADFWNVYLQDKLKDGAKITAGDTAALAIMIKLAREMNAPKEDNKTDIAGYAACWAEVDARTK